jgi:tetratricopeptide (TPR) repeat protein
LRVVATYSVGDAARILKVSPQRLRYWARTELVSPQSGKDQGFEFRDLVGARAVITLLDQGVPLRRIRQSVERLRQRLPEIDDPLAALRVGPAGSERVVVRHGDLLLEPEGQLLLDFGQPPGPGEPVARFGRAGPETESEAALASAAACFEQGCKLDADPGTYKEAVVAYERAIEFDPDFADAHCNLGAVLFNQGRRGAARQCFERCLELDPGHIEALFNLANLLEEEGCDDMALRHYRAALEANPFYVDVHVNLALLCEKMNLRRTATQHWKRYLQLDPSGSWGDLARQRLGLEER